MHVTVSIIFINYYTMCAYDFLMDFNIFISSLIILRPRYFPQLSNVADCEKKKKKKQWIDMKVASSQSLTIT